MAKKEQVSARELLNSISVNISAFLRLFRYHADLSESYTKRGPGRKHKQGKQRVR